MVIRNISRQLQDKPREGLHGHEKIRGNMDDLTGSTSLRSDLVRHAFRIEWLTLLWMIIEAGVAIGSGIAADSLSLIAFGADSLIELASAGVLLWRLSVELRDGEEFSEAVERRASKIAGAMLFALAVYVVASAAYGLLRHEGQRFSTPGLVLAIVAIPIMWFLAKAKIRIADRIGSRALRADAVESITCGYLSSVVLLGMLAQLLVGAWWIDSATSVVIVGLLIKEGHEAWRGDDCDETGLQDR
jgi:divalent metal cation (Fe/Co/Zn/Cd) transporter